MSTTQRAPQRAGRRRVSPGLVMLVVALVGSLAYLGFAITVRDSSQIPLLASGAVVLAIVFIGLAVYCARATLRASSVGRNGRAMLIAIIGAGAALAGAACVAGAVILFQLSGLD